MVCGVLAVLAGVARGLWHPPQPDPYVDMLRARIAVLRPDVERELGVSLGGRIDVSVATRSELGAMFAAANDEMGIEAPVEPGPTHGTLGHVDRDGGIWICREEFDRAPHEDLLGSIMDIMVPRGDPLGADLLDVVLIHELVHVAQHRTLGLSGYIRAARSPEAVLARRAVLEGHAELVTARVAERRDLTEAVPRMTPTENDSPVKDMYLLFEVRADALRMVFPYVHGRAFVESAFARLGRDVALRRLAAEPPALPQIVAPETWPGPPPAPAGTGSIRRRVEDWLATWWESTEGTTLPAPAFLALLEPATPESRERARNALLEAERFSAEGGPMRHQVRGHLLAARDETGAQDLLEACVEAARARDKIVPSHPKMQRGGVVEAQWDEIEIDGHTAHTASRSYWISEMVGEAAVIVRDGRYVLELRWVENPGGETAAARLARQLLAFIDASIDGRVDAWEPRFRAAAATATPTRLLDALVDDRDPDVRVAALRNLAHRQALPEVERHRVCADPDPLVRLTARVQCFAGEEPEEADLLAALHDADAWVVGAGCLAAAEHFMSWAISADDLAPALRHPERRVRRAASRLLKRWTSGGADPERDVELHHLALADSDVAVRYRATEALFHAPNDLPGIRDAYRTAVLDTDAGVRSNALIALTVRADGIPGLTETLVSLMETGGEGDANLAVEALASQGEEARSAVPAIRRHAAALADGSRRLEVLATIGALTGDSGELFDEAARLLTHGTRNERRDAAGALGRLGRDGAAHVDALVELLQTDDPGLQRAGLHALGEIGWAAASALPAIRALRDDRNRLVRQSARGAEREIRDDRP